MKPKGVEYGQMRLPNVPEQYEPPPIRFGDTDPIENGGGYLFQAGVRYWIEWTPGHEEGLKGRTVYQVDLPEDVTAYYDWADWPGVLQCCGIGENLPPHQRLRMARLQGRHLDPMIRLRLMEDMASFHSWDNLDSQPLRMTTRELRQRWAAAEAAARRAVYRTPWKPASVGAHRRARRMR